MNRRAALGLLGVGVGVPGGYLAWNRHRSPTLPDGIEVDTLYLEGNTFGEPAPEGREPGPREQYHELVRTAAEIERDETAVAFAEETDFDASALVAVLTGMQSEPDLALEAISRTDDGLHIDVAVEHPWWRGVEDDLLTHSLLVRITDEVAGQPESISVDIEGYV
ncbi:hypothetical protein OB905_00970 [Halobacteria archaeon AArc-dxtr1]|nr:hypothetical protein [Halobacteria archaeon AArc-dxtr1]